MSYLNDGAGSYTMRTNSAVPDMRVGAISGEGQSAVETAYDIGDIDGDGDIDALVVTTALNALYRNDGSATFTSVDGSAVAASLMASQDGCFGDYDGDGDVSDQECPTTFALQCGRLT